jgi:hypothetical protein
LQGRAVEDFKGVSLKEGKGADWLVDEAVELSERLKIPQMVVGATIVNRSRGCGLGDCGNTPTTAHQPFCRPTVDTLS